MRNIRGRLARVERKSGAGGPLFLIYAVGDDGIIRDPGPHHGLTADQAGRLLPPGSVVQLLVGLSAAEMLG